VLHTWRPPAAVLDALLPRPLTDPADPSATVGADINPLPLTRTLALAPHVADLPHVDAGLVSETTATLAELAPLAPPLDDPTATGLTHGDLHLNNFWWTGTPATGRLSALLDLEWARFAPPWVDLERLALNAHTELTTGADTGTNSRPYLNLIADLRTHYPEPFATDRLPARLRYYAMAQILRQVLVEPPDAPEPELDPDHPLRILHRLLTEGENAWSQVLGR
jgi:hypothetical protein